jgi:hypothetical protein
VAETGAGLSQSRHPGEDDGVVSKTRLLTKAGYLQLSAPFFSLSLP